MGSDVHLLIFDSFQWLVALRAPYGALWIELGVPVVMRS